MIPFAGGAVPPVHSILCQKRSGLPGTGSGISNKFCPQGICGDKCLCMCYGNIIFIQLEKIMLRGKKGLTTISVNDIVTVQSVQQIITVTNENKIWAQKRRRG